MDLFRLLNLGRLFAFSACALISLASFAGPSVTFQGRILNPQGGALEEAGVQIRVTVLSPDVNQCILFDETHTVDLTNSGGLFTVALNDGTGLRNDLNAWTFATALSNANPFTVSPVSCVSGTTYTPSLLDERKVAVYFQRLGMAGWEEMTEPTNRPALTHAPFALESRAIGGFGANNLCRVADGGVPQTVTPMTSANYGELINLVSGTSTRYMARSSNGGAALPSYSGAPGTSSTGDMWYDSTSNQIKYNNGSGTQTLGTSGAGISSLIIGTGLTPTGTISTGGTTIAVNVGTGANQIVQMTAGAKLPAVDGSNLTGLTGAQVTGMVQNGGQAGAITIGPSDANALTLNTTGAARMTISASGNVGIGTATPTNGLFDVEQTGTDSMSPTAAGFFMQNLTMTTNGSLTSRALNIQARTSVGTGVTSTGSLTGQSIYAMRNYGLNGDNGTMPSVNGLQISYGHFNSDATAAPITSGNASGIAISPSIRKGNIAGNMYDVLLSGTGIGGTLVGTHYGFYQTDTTSPNYFGSSVGIGTTAPAAALHISSSSAGAMILARQTNAINTAIGMNFYENDSASTAITTGQIFSAMSTNTAGAVDGYLSFYTRSAGTLGEKVRVAANGYVGVGTTTPASKLDVFGTINATAFTLNGSAFTPATNSTAVTATGGSAGTITQSATDAATALRTALTLQNTGTGGVNEYLLVGKNAAGTTTFSVTQAGAATLAGGLTSSGVVASTSLVAPLLSGSTANSANLTLDSTTGTTKGNVFIAPTGGNVGIGTTNPHQALEVGATSAAVRLASAGSTTTYSELTDSATQLIFDKQTAAGGSVIDLNPRANDSTSAQFVRMFRNSTVTGSRQFQVMAGTAIDSQIGVGTTSFLNASAGSVGIGTANPLTKLQVSGDISTVTSGTSKLWSGYAGNYIYLQEGNPAQVVSYKAMTFGTNGTTGGMMTIDLTGNVGVGTTAPLAPLHIAKTAPIGTITTVSTAVTGSGTNFTSAFAVGDQVIAAGQTKTITAITSATVMTLSAGFSSDLATATAYSRVGTILNAGNVGIGTTAPLVALDVTSSTSGTGAIKVQNTSTNGYASIDMYDSSSAIQGSVGWGNSAATAVLRNLLYFGTTSSSPVVIRTAGTERIRFDSTGNVGIGTAVPTAMLTVAGAIASLQNNPTITGSSPSWASTLTLASSNTFYLNPSTAVASDVLAITFSGTPANGGNYLVSVKDPVVMNISFTAASCGTIKYKPASNGANAITTAGTSGTLISLTTIYNGTNYDCYVGWSTGYQ